MRQAPQLVLYQLFASRAKSGIAKVVSCAPAATAIGAILLSGCGGSGATPPNSSNSFFSITPGVANVDTNCTGCNAHRLTGRGASGGGAVLDFSATQTSGEPADVIWTLAGGDPVAGAGTITPDGAYTPPSYLTADRVEVIVTGALKDHPQIRASAALTVTPGFQQPLTPQNAALGPGGTVTVSGTLAEAGGGTAIQFVLSNSPSGATGGAGSLSAPLCQRSTKSFTSCSVTYTAPTTVLASAVTYVVALTGSLGARTEAAVLLNPAAVTSTPISHQTQLAIPMALGTSGGNNNDFDRRGNAVVDCCSGTLGALVQDGSGRQYLLSNNHILARSDHAAPGDAIVQPGLIDNNCTPNGEGPGTIPVASLAAWRSLRSPSTNVDAAIAQVASHTVDPTGAILELGPRQPDSTLAAAPPGISSSEGKGEPATLQMRVAKSGRTTGLTCGAISAVAVDVEVDYYSDCAETKPYLTKTFSNQISVSGNRFSDAGDSGSLLVDAADAEPVGLYFAGGTDANGVVQGVANPANEVLTELTAEIGNQPLTFVGGPDRPVSCLSFGDNTIAASQARSLSDREIARVQQALAIARQWVNPAMGVLGVAMGKSNDRPGEAAVLVYTDANSRLAVPQLAAGVRTVIIPAAPRAVALGAAPMFVPMEGAPAVDAVAINRALIVKREQAPALMRANSAFFGIGVGQSFDNPREAALVVYVDRQRQPSTLPSILGGLRVRYVIMDRLHVTRSYVVPFQTHGRCLPHASGDVLSSQ